MQERILMAIRNAGAPCTQATLAAVPDCGMKQNHNG
jgi:hypothetical protein